MKKLTSIILCFCICVSLVACGTSQTTPFTPSEQSAVSEVLIENDTLTVTFMGAQDAASLGVFYVTLKIENKTDTSVTISLEDADVDGETIPLITTGVPLTIAPGNSGQTGFIFSMVNLSISSMSGAEKATFSVVARNSDTFDTVYKSDRVTVNLK